MTSKREQALQGFFYAANRLARYQRACNEVLTTAILEAGLWCCMVTPESRIFCFPALHLQAPRRY